HDRDIVCTRDCACTGHDERRHARERGGILCACDEALRLSPPAECEATQAGIATCARPRSEIALGLERRIGAARGTRVHVCASATNERDLLGTDAVGKAIHPALALPRSSAGTSSETIGRSEGSAPL